MPPTAPVGFHIEACAFDGKSIGNSYWEIARLSDKWLTVFAEFLRELGPIFNTPLTGNLAHIRVRLTSTRDAALGTLCVHDLPATSLLLLGGQSPDAEKEITKMFVESLTRSFPPRLVSGDPDSFQHLFAISARPAAAIVVLPCENISADDCELVREITLHLAGAFFVRMAEQMSPELPAQN